MRFQLIFYVMLLFVTTLAHAAIDNTMVSNPAYKKPIVVQKKNSHSTLKEKKTLGLSRFNTKNIFVNGSAIYALMTDGGINGTPYAETIVSGVTGNAYVPRLNAGWGYQVSLGYKEHPKSEKYSLLNYTSIGTSGNSTVGVGNKAFLFNNLTQLGPAGVGFQIMFGPANALVHSSIQYQNIDLLFYRPTNDDVGASKIKFTKSLGLRAMHINKNLVGDYTGYVPNPALLDGFTPVVDNVNYSSSYYGIGPQVGYFARYQLNSRIQLKGGGVGAALAGYYHSSLHETASSGVPIVIGDIASSNFTDEEIHPTQAWTPLVFVGNISVLIDAIHNKKTGFLCSVEGGIADEYIVPTFTNDSFIQDNGVPLARFNNSLNLAFAFVKVIVNLD